MIRLKITTNRSTPLLIKSKRLPNQIMAATSPKVESSKRKKLRLRLRQKRLQMKRLQSRAAGKRTQQKRKRRDNRNKLSKLISSRKKRPN